MIQQKFIEHLQKQGIDEAIATILLVFAKEPNGLNEELAPSFVATFARRNNSQIIKGISFSLARNYLVLNSQNNLEMNFSALKVPEELIKSLQEKTPAFIQLGHPHEQEAMTSLKRMLMDTEESIFIATELTDPNAFKMILERSKQNKKTIFILPDKKFCKDKIIYHETIQKWISFINDSDSHTRNNVAVYINKRCHRELYTSAISPQSARFDLYNVTNPSTREGIMIEAHKESSLYELIETAYKNAFSTSIPLFSLHKFSFILRMLKTIILPIFIIIIFFIIADMQNIYVKVILPIIIALITVPITNELKKHLFPIKELWKK